MRRSCFIVFLCFASYVIAQESASRSLFPGLPLDESKAPFYFGVASGDPDSSGFVAWTKVIPEWLGDNAEVALEVSEDEAFENIIFSRIVMGDRDRGYTVKVNVEGLKPNTQYYYRFEYEGRVSPVGKARTLPTHDVERLRFGVVSCSNYEWGHFNAHGVMAKQNLDFVIHLGDYIYEYGPGGYGDTTLGRKHFPPHEIITETDYRLRYAQYRSDKNLQAAHAAHPFISVWDDHEISNDAYTDGAQNHQSEEGDYDDRKAVAVNAYFEWMPIRESDNQQVYRTIDMGPMASLIMLDERLEGRQKPLESLDKDSMVEYWPELLGERQMNWLERELMANKRWKIIGNQVIFSDLFLGFIGLGTDFNTDAWDGYQGDKARLTHFIDKNQLSNTVFLTGDTHCSWAFEIKDEDDKETIAAEFGTPSISSANYDEYVKRSKANLGRRLFRLKNKHLKYCNVVDHGFMVLTLEKTRAVARWFYVDTLREPNLGYHLAKTIYYDPVKKKLTKNP